MKLLETYILRRVGQMFLVALLPVLAIIWTTQVLQRINLVTDSGQSVGSFAKLATLILPSIIPVVLPFALVIAVTQTLTTMNNDSELAVIDAAGARRSIIWRPIIILAAVISVFSFFVDNVVEPKAKTAVRQMVAAAYADLLSTVIEEKNFRRIDTGLYVQISERLAGRVLKGLFVVDERDPAFELIYYAREGAVDEKGTSLIMHDGEVHRKTPAGDVSVIRFDGDARSHREARLHPMVSALVMAFVVRWATFYAANQIDDKPIYIVVLYAIPIIISITSVASLVLHRRISLVGFVANQVVALWRKVHRLLPKSAGPSAGGR
jgi:lipopolysaccharide export LptBFGC system permease protein LptF